MGNLVYMLKKYLISKDGFFINMLDRNSSYPYIHRQLH